MQPVNVIGVSNPMQFPDDMDINDIRDFLRKKFTKQMIEGTQSRDLDPLQGQARATEQSLAEKAGQGISNALYDSGVISDRYGAQRIGKNVTSIGEFLPVIGDATAGDEFGRALKQGDGVGMAIGALGAIPLIGDAAKKAVKLKPHQVSPTSKEWSEFGFDEINREAFGVTESDVTKLSPSELNIKWTDDLDNVEYEIKNSGKTRKEWAEGVDLSTPIDVIIEDGVYKIDDGHHRYSAAKILGKDLPVSLQINDQPFVGLAKRATERGEEVHPAIMKAAVDRGFKPPKGSGDKAMSVPGSGVGGIKTTKSPFNLGGEVNDRLEVDGAHIDVVESEWSPTKFSIVEFLTDENARGQGKGGRLLDEAISKYGDELSGAFSSKESLTAAYNRGFRPTASDKKGKSLEQLSSGIKGGESVTMSFKGFDAEKPVVSTANLKDLEDALALEEVKYNKGLELLKRELADASPHRKSQLKAQLRMIKKPLDAARYNLNKTRSGG